MALDKEDALSEPVERQTESTEREGRAPRIDDAPERREEQGNRKPKSLRSVLKGAVREVGDQERGRRAAEETPARDKDNSAKDASQKEGSPAQKEIPAKEKTSENATESTAQPQTKRAPPAALSKEIKAIWDTIPAEVQAEFERREADTQKGVEQLKSKFKPIEDAFAPHREELQAIGKTEADAVTQLLGWHKALTGPNKVHTARALLQAHNIDPRSLIQGQQAQNGGASQAQPDPMQQFRPLLDPLSQKVSALETDLQRRDRERVNSDIESMSKDKPHFEKVRIAMGHLMQSGLAVGSNPKEMFEDAYQRACRADPEVFQAMQAEADAKREADAKVAKEAADKKAADEAEERRRNDLAAVEKARKAQVGPRSSSPSGGIAATAKRGTSVRDSIVSAAKGAAGRL